MEIRDNTIINGKGLYTIQAYKKGEIVFILSGEIFDKPSRETIHIGNNKHIYDSFGIFINHSFTPSVYIDNVNVIALHDISIDTEITFNYNTSEINMASPFYVDNKIVSGKT